MILGAPDWTPLRDTLLNLAVSFTIAASAAIALIVIYRLVLRPLSTTWLGPWVSSFDRLLVTRIAPLTGIRFIRPWVRWCCFLGLNLTILGGAIVLPLPAALLSLLLGIMLTVALYRAWAHDEEKRQRAEDHLGTVTITDDLGNEIIAGLFFLILFFTLAFVRLAEANDVFSGASNVGFAPVAFFLWGEVLKAVPMVDVSEVFAIQNPSGLEASGSLGRMMTFSFRAFLDLLILTALLRIVAIVRRQSSGQDLRQLRLDLASGEVDRIEGALSRLWELAADGRSNAQAELELIAMRDRNVAVLKEAWVLERVGLIFEDLFSRLSKSRYSLLAVEAFRSALAQVSRRDDHDVWLAVQTKLAHAQLAHGQSTANPQSLREAGELLNIVLQEFGAHAPAEDRAAAWQKLGQVRNLQGIHHANASAFDDAIRCLEKARTILPVTPDDNSLAEIEMQMGNVYYSRSELLQTREDLVLAMTCYERTVELLDDVETGRFREPRLRLAAVRAGLARLDVDLDALEQASIELSNLQDKVDPDRGFDAWIMYINVRAGVLNALLSYMPSEDRALELKQLAKMGLERCSEEYQPLYWASLTYMHAQSLFVLGGLQKSETELQEAVVLSRRALDHPLCEDQLPLRLNFHIQIVILMLELSRQTGLPEYSAEAIDFLNRAEQEVPALQGTALWFRFVLSLAGATYNLGDMNGDIGFLRASERHIAALNEHLPQLTAGQPGLIVSYFAGRTYRRLAELTQEPEYLKMAIAEFETNLRLPESSSSIRVLSVVRRWHAECLFAFGKQTKDADSVRRALAAFEDVRARALARSDNDARLAAEREMAKANHWLGKKLSSAADLEAAVARHREVVALSKETGNASTFRHDSQDLLVSCHALAKLTQQATDYDAAIAEFRNMLADEYFLDEEPEQWIQMQFWCADALLARYELDPSIELLDDAKAGFRAAEGHPLAQDGELWLPILQGLCRVAYIRDEIAPGPESYEAMLGAYHRLIEASGDNISDEGYFNLQYDLAVLQTVYSLRNMDPNLRDAALAIYDELLLTWTQERDFNRWVTLNYQSLSAVNRYAERTDDTTHLQEMILRCSKTLEACQNDGTDKDRLDLLVGLVRANIKLADTTGVVELAMEARRQIEQLVELLELLEMPEPVETYRKLSQDLDKAIEAAMTELSAESEL